MTSHLLGFVHVLLLLAAIAGTLRAQTPSRAEPGLLWEISGNGLEHPSYLFGTIHVSDKRVFNFSDSVLPALLRSEVFASEVDFQSALPDLMERLLNQVESPRKIDMKEALTDEEYQVLKEAVDDALGVPVENIRYTNPFILRYLLLQAQSRPYSGEREQEGQYSSEEQHPYFLDAYLYRIARLEGKEITGVETIDEHLGGLGLEEMDDENALIREAKDLVAYLQNSDTADAKDQMEELISLYARGNLDSLMLTIERERPQNRMLYYRLFTRRNRQMAERIVPLIRERRAFIAVGAGHLPGDDGLITLLREQGFRVRPVTATYTGAAAAYREPDRRLEWMKYSSDEGAFAMEVPLKPVSLPEIPIEAGVVFRMYLVLDLMTGINYAILYFDLPAGGVEIDPEVMLPAIMASMGRRFDRTEMRDSVIAVDSVQGIEITATDEEGKIERMRILIRGARAYMFLAGYAPNSPDMEDVDRFMESIHFIPFPEQNWQTFTSETGACRIEFPGEPRQITSSSALDIDQTAIQIMHTFSAEDRADGTFYRLVYSDLPPGYLPGSDSATLAVAVESSSEEMGTAAEEVESLDLDGHQGVAFTLPAYNGGRIVKRFYTRNNRFYELTVGGYEETLDREGMERFFNSFEFLDYRQTEWEKHTLLDYGISVELPNEPKIDVSDYSSRWDITSQDTATGFSYIIRSLEYSPYHSVESIDTFFSRWTADMVDPDETLVASERLTLDGDPVLDLEVADEKVVHRIRLILHGRYLYQLTAPLPRSYVHHRTTDNFFASFGLLNPPEGDILTPKHDQFLADLLSSDTALRNRAADEVWNVEFPPDYVQQLQQTIRQMTDTASVSVDARTNLLWKLNGLYRGDTAERAAGNTAMIGFIRSLYPTLDADPMKSTALQMLISMNTRESLLLFRDLVLVDPPPTSDIFMFGLSGTPDTAAVLFPDILKLADSAGYRYELYTLTAAVLDSGTVSPDDIAPYHSRLIDSALLDARTQVAEAYRDTIDYSLVFLAEAAVGMLERLGAVDEAEGVIRQLAEDPNTMLRRKAALTLLRAEKEVDPRIWSSVAADSYFRPDLYLDLKRMGHLELFPDEYHAQHLFAESGLVRWLEDYDGYAPDTVEYVTGRVIDWHGKRGRAFLFRFGYSDNPDTWYTGVSGLQPENPEKIEPECELVNTLWEEFDPDAVDEQFRQLVDEAYYEE